MQFSSHFDPESERVAIISEIHAAKDGRSLNRVMSEIKYQTKNLPIDRRKFCETLRRLLEEERFSLAVKLTDRVLGEPLPKNSWTLFLFIVSFLVSALFWWLF